MDAKELEDLADELKCAFCRNPLTQSSKVNVKEYGGDFVSVMCDDCDKQYKEHEQLGPKFLICLCSDKPKEFDLAMSKQEIDAQVKGEVTVLDKVQELGLENELYPVEPFDEEKEPKRKKKQV